MDDQDRARQAFFNQRAAGWLDTFYKDPDTGAHDKHGDRIRALVETLEIRPGHQVLDLGCGSGVLVPYILEKLDRARDGKRTGGLAEMDYAREMIEQNRQVHTDPRISFHCAHVMDMPFESGRFDAVICFACFPHFQDQEGAVAQIARVMKPGARLTIAHLMSSAEIAGHHRSETPVSADCLPPRERLEAWLKNQGLEVTGFEDRPGTYCLTAIRI